MSREEDDAVALVRVYCGLASADLAEPQMGSEIWLTVAVVDDAGRLIDICEVSDDAGGYAELSALLAQRSGGQSAVAVAADSDDHVVTQLLTAAGRNLAYTDDDSADDYAERFADDESPEEIQSNAAERRAVGLARALQAGVLSAVGQSPPRDMLTLKPVLAAHAAVVAGRQGAAATLREVLRELYPAALRAYPDPAEPIPLAVLNALPEPGILGGGAAGRGRDAQVVAELAETGVADATTLSEAITALRVAIAETPRRTGINRTLTAAVAETIRQSVAAVRASDAAASSLVGVLADKMNNGTTFGRATAGRQRPNTPLASVAAPLRSAPMLAPAAEAAPSRSRAASRAAEAARVEESVAARATGGRRRAQPAAAQAKTPMQAQPLVVSAPPARLPTPPATAPAPPMVVSAPPAVVSAPPMVVSAPPNPISARPSVVSAPPTTPPGYQPAPYQPAAAFQPSAVSYAPAPPIPPTYQPQQVTAPYPQQMPVYPQQAPVYPQQVQGHQQQVSSYQQQPVPASMQSIPVPLQAPPPQPVPVAPLPVAPAPVAPPPVAPRPVIPPMAPAAMNQPEFTSLMPPPPPGIAPLLLGHEPASPTVPPSRSGYDFDSGSFNAYGYDPLAKPTSTGVLPASPLAAGASMPSTSVGEPGVGRPTSAPPMPTSVPPAQGGYEDRLSDSGAMRLSDLSALGNPPTLDPQTPPPGSRANWPLAGGESSDIAFGEPFSSEFSSLPRLSDLPKPPADLPAELEPARSDFADNGYGRHDYPARADRVRADRVQDDRVRDDRSWADPGREEFARAEFPRDDYTRDDLSRSDFSRAESARSDFSTAERARSDFSTAERALPDFSTAERARSDFSTGEQTRAMPSRLDAGRAESRAEIHPEAARSDSRAENRSAARPDDRFDSRAESRPDGRLQSRAESRSGGILDSRSGSRAENQSEGRPDASRSANPRSESSRSESIRAENPRSEAPRSERSRTEIPRSDRSRTEIPRSDRSRAERPVELPRQREGRIAPPWQTDDLPAEPAGLRLVEPAPLPEPALSADRTYSDELSGEFRYEPPALRLVEADRPAERATARSNGSGAGRSRRAAAERAETTKPASNEGDGDLLIFAAARSAWFTDWDAEVEAGTEAPAAAQNVNWENLNDVGWRAAEQASHPSVIDETHSGLPRRVPQQNLVPGSPINSPERPLRIVRDAAQIAAHTTGYFRGWRRGQEVGGFAVGGRPGRESAGGWDFSREASQDHQEREYEYRAARR